MQNPGYGALSDAFSQSDLIFYVSKVASISPTGAPATGQLLSVATGSFLAPLLIDVVLDATANSSPERGLAEAGIERLAVP
jgi:hypothetical protein